MRKSLGIITPIDTLSTAAAHKGQTKHDKAEPSDLVEHLQLLGESLGTTGACLRVQVREIRLVEQQPSGTQSCWEWL